LPAFEIIYSSSRLGLTAGAAAVAVAESRITFQQPKNGCNNKGALNTRTRKKKKKTRWFNMHENHNKL
jgi:hypothetical protein